MRKEQLLAPLGIYLYIPYSKTIESTYQIQLEMPLPPIYTTPVERKSDTSESVRVYNLFGDEKI
jgi:hypothetical protein